MTKDHTLIHTLLKDNYQFILSIIFSGKFTQTYLGWICNKYARKELSAILRNVHIVRDLVLNSHYFLHENREIIYAENVQFSERMEDKEEEKKLH